LENKVILLVGLGGTLETMDKTPEQNLVFKVRFEYEIPVKTGDYSASARISNKKLRQSEKRR